jgi:hypothetical protein
MYLDGGILFMSEYFFNLGTYIFHLRSADIENIVIKIAGTNKVNQFLNGTGQDIFTGLKWPVSGYLSPYLFSLTK